MGYRRVPFAPGEDYHCYTRGIDKRITFQTQADYEMFVQAIYVCNDASSFHRNDLSVRSHSAILNLDRGEQLVSVIAYCLMPNHYHIIIRERVDGGIARFMQKLGTMYTMYFNVKNGRTGGLFVGPFRSKHIDSDTYLKRVISYVHLNPAELFEPGWKNGNVHDMRTLRKSLESYRFSSLMDYSQPRGEASRSERRVLDLDLAQSLYERLPTLDETLLEAAEYYRDLRW